MIKADNVIYCEWGSYGMKLCHRSCIWLESEGWRLYSRPRAQFFPIWTNLDWERLVFSSWFAFFLPLPDWCGDDSQPRLMGFESMISQSHLRSLIATHWDASGKKFKPIPIKSYQTMSKFVSLLREFWSGFIETKPQWSLQPIGTQRRITRNQ